MRIFDDEALNVLWNWGHVEKDDLTNRFKANLARLLKNIERKMDQTDKNAPDDLEALSLELQDAGELLNECRRNCLDLAATVRCLAGKSHEEREQRMNHLQRLEDAVGERVVLTQTDIKELRGKILILEEIQGIKAVVRNGNEYWETPIDRIMAITKSPNQTQTDPPRQNMAQA